EHLQALQAEAGEGVVGDEVEAEGLRVVHALNLGCVSAPPAAPASRPLLAAAGAPASNRRALRCARRSDASRDPALTAARAWIRGAVIATCVAPTGACFAGSGVIGRGLLAVGEGGAV